MTTEHVIWLFVWVAVNQGGVPIPVVPSLVAAGALAGTGHADLPTLVAVIVGASLTADLAWYGIGRWRSAQALRLLDRLSRRAAERVEAARSQFVAHQLGFIFCCRFLPEVNPLAAGMAGAARVAPTRYAGVAAISALAWAGTWIGAGYALHHVTIALTPASATLAAFIVGTVLVAAAVLALGRWRRARSSARADGRRSR